MLMQIRFLPNTQGADDRGSMFSIQKFANLIVTIWGSRFDTLTHGGKLAQLNNNQFLVISSQILQQKLLIALSNYYKSFYIQPTIRLQTFRLCVLKVYCGLNNITFKIFYKRAHMQDCMNCKMPVYVVVNVNFNR